MNVWTSTKDIRWITLKHFREGRKIALFRCLQRMYSVLHFRKSARLVIGIILKMFTMK